MKGNIHDRKDQAWLHGIFDIIHLIDPPPPTITSLRFIHPSALGDL